MRDAATTPSLTERTNIAIGAALAGRKRGAFTPLLFAGPAVIASIAYMDPGNFATNIQAGAKYGYSLLWVVVMANLIAMLFRALSAAGHRHQSQSGGDVPRPVFTAGSDRHVAAQRSGGDGHRSGGVSRRGDRAGAAVPYAAAGGDGGDGGDHLCAVDGGKKVSARSS